jgi:hypothetical protein
MAAAPGWLTAIGNDGAGDHAVPSYSATSALLLRLVSYPPATYNRGPTVAAAPSWIANGSEASVCCVIARLGAVVAVGAGPLDVLAVVVDRGGAVDVVGVDE